VKRAVGRKFGEEVEKVEKVEVELNGRDGMR